MLPVPATMKVTPVARQPSRLALSGRPARHRSRRHYDEKWAYVRENPVRAGLGTEPDAWPWQRACHPCLRSIQRRAVPSNPVEGIALSMPEGARP